MVDEHEQSCIAAYHELNVIPPGWKGYFDTNFILGKVIQQEGCAVLYSTHQRSTEDALQGESPEGPQLMNRRKHECAKLPRIETEQCVQGLPKNATYQPSFLCAVLRGRIPALVLQRGEIDSYAEAVMEESPERLEK